MDTKSIGHSMGLTVPTAPAISISAMAVLADADRSPDLDALLPEVPIKAAAKPVCFIPVCYKPEH